jgi:hypothetical protein
METTTDKGCRITPPESKFPAIKHYLRYEVFMAVTMKNAAFWDVLSCVPTANIAPSSLILSILIMDVIRSSKTWVLTEPHGATSQKTEFFTKHYGSTVITTGYTFQPASTRACMLRS